LIAVAATLAFDSARLLLVDLVGRGWGIPGGDLETGEDPVEAVRRPRQRLHGARPLHVDSTVARV
jgi:ADP-ribose pyrophosphatase YjhB (NUDIX family)